MTVVMPAGAVYVDPRAALAEPGHTAARPRAGRAAGRPVCMRVGLDHLDAAALPIVGPDLVILTVDALRGAATPAGARLAHELAAHRQASPTTVLAECVDTDATAVATRIGRPRPGIVAPYASVFDVLARSHPVRVAPLTLVSELIASEIRCVRAAGVCAVTIDMSGIAATVALVDAADGLRDDDLVDMRPDERVVVIIGPRVAMAIATRPTIDPAMCQIVRTAGSATVTGIARALLRRLPDRAPEDAR